MADVFVDSNASGSASGESFADAHATLSAGYGDSNWGSGDTLYIASDHAETISNTTYDSGESDKFNRRRVVSWDTSANAYQSMADGGGAITLTGTTVYLKGSAWIEGVKVTTTNGDVIPSGAGASIDLVDCYFDCGTTGDYMSLGNNDLSIRVRSCVIKGTLSVFASGQETVSDFIDCEFANHSNGTYAVNLADANTAMFRACEINGGDASETEVAAGNSNSHCIDILFEDCELPQPLSAAMEDDRRFGRVSSVRTGTGVPASSSAIKHITQEGTAETVSTVYRNAADAAGGGYSLKMVATSTASEAKPMVQRFSVPVAASDTTFKIHFAYTSTEVSDGRDFFAYVVTPNESTGYQGKFRTNYTPTGGDSFSSSSGWTGSGFNTQSSIDFSISPTYGGVADLFVCLATAATVFVDPEIEVA